MKRFRNRTLQMMVATDVAARGLDVNDLTHVINYNLPDEADTYIHRSGRTGRADKTGICISIIHMKEKFKIKMIEKKVGREFAKAKIPTGVQVCEKQLFHHIDRMENVEVNREEIESFLPVIYRKLEWMDREEIIKRFVSLEFNRFLDYYRDARDLNVEESRDSRGEVSRFQRMFFSVGRKDKMAAQQIIGLINEVTRSRDVRIGRIDIMHAFSFVDVDSNSVELLKRSFASEKQNPLRVRIELASDRDGASSQPKRKKPSFGGKREDFSGDKKQRKDFFSDSRGKRSPGKDKKSKFKRR